MPLIRKRLRKKASLDLIEQADWWQSEPDLEEYDDFNTALP